MFEKLRWATFIVMIVFCLLGIVACTATSMEPTIPDQDSVYIEPEQESSLPTDVEESEVSLVVSDESNPEQPRPTPRATRVIEEEATETTETETDQLVEPPTATKEPETAPQPEKDPLLQPTAEKDRTTAVIQGEYDEMAASALASYLSEVLQADLQAIATMEHLVNSAPFAELGAVNGEGWCVSAKVRVEGKRPYIYQTFIINTGDKLQVLDNEVSEADYHHVGCIHYFPDFEEQK